MDKPASWLQDAWLRIQLDTPPSIQYGLLAQLHNLKEIARLAARPFLPVYELSGLGSGGPLTVTFVNVRFSKSSWESILYVDTPDVKQVGSIPFWRCSELANLESSDLIIVEGTKHLIQRLPDKNAFVLPEFVRHILDVTGDWQTVQNRFRPTIRKKILPILSKVPYEFVLSQSNRDFEEFYNHMYLPTMNNRHGNLAWPMSFREAYLYFRHGQLIQIKRQGDWVAGVVCQPEGETLLERIVGIKEGDPQLIHERLTYVIHFASTRWANEHGFRSINFLGSEPFLEDGLFQHKRSWGGSIVLPSSLHRRLWLKVRRFNPAVSQFLKTNPFITTDRYGNLRGQVFVDDFNSLTDETSQSWKSRYLTPGLKSLEVRSTQTLAEPNTSDERFQKPAIVF